jgi:hypothetical protein
MSGTLVLDLSKTSEIYRFGARCQTSRITVALQTVQSKNLQRITIHPACGCTTSVNLIGEAVRQEWQDLDHLLLQFWATYSIRPKIMYEADKGGDDLRASAPSLLPELTRRGLVDLVESRPQGTADPDPLFFIFV